MSEVESKAMQVTLNKLDGLQRCVNVSIPAKEVDAQVEKKLLEYAKQVKLPGFRPGKVPLNVIKSRYEGAVRQDVAEGLLQETLQNAVQQHELRLAGSPQVEITKAKPGGPFEYKATFEIYPEIKLKALTKKVKIDEFEVTIEDKDIKKVTENLRKQNAEWSEVERAAKKGDRIKFDYESFIKDEPVEKGKADGVEIELGLEQLLPKFDEKMTGVKPGEQKEIKLKLPKDFNNPVVAGKSLKMKVSVHTVSEATLPALDDDFAKKLNIDEGLAALKTKIKESLTQESERRVKDSLRHNLVEYLVKNNKVVLPNILVEDEAKRLRKERVTQLEQQGVKDVGELELKLFTDAAKRRVTIGLIFAELIEQLELKIDQARVEKKLEEIAASFGAQREQVIEFYRGQKERMAEVESAVLEEQLIDAVLDKITCVKKKMDYEQLINWNPNKDE